MLDIKFFTAGCPRSQISGKNLNKALTQLGLDQEIQFFDDPKDHEKYGVTSFPAVMINNNIESEGDFLQIDDCEEILEKYTS